jgi:hypothetical protein
MSDDLVNIRIGMWHFHINRRLQPTLSRNEYHRGYPDGVFAVYEFFGWL